MAPAVDLMTHSDLVGGVLGELKDHQALPVELYAILAKVENIQCADSVPAA